MKKLLRCMAVIIAVMLYVIGLPMNTRAAEPQNTGTQASVEVTAAGMLVKEQETVETPATGAQIAEQKTGNAKTTGADGQTTAAAQVSEQTAENAQAAANDIAAFQLVFDAAYYYCAYPDVAAAFGTDYDLLLQHYIKDGAIHGRSASAEFNLQVYKSSYKDLEEAFGDNLAAYCRHYISFGKKEGRIANKPEAANVNTENAPAVLRRTGQTIGTCTTYYNAKIPRATNVILAASRINGVTLQPGEQFSYNIAVLPRTAANGYVNAPVFVNGGHGMGIGGGICQVSSTLYAAMLSCGLPATERHPHSLPVTYLPAGYDATISGNAKDLKFVNIYSQPLQIRASADDGVLTVWLVLL